jgi:hypothetical protein
MNHQVFMPERIAALPRDKRGYPVPFVVMWDATGPQFAVNEVALVAQCILEGLCHVCGQRLEPEPWFAGGAANAVMNGEHAVYIDGPMHLECAIFSLQACPHLSHQLPSALNLDPIRRHLNQQGAGVFDNTVIPGVPALFALVQARDGHFGATLTEADGIRWLVERPFAGLQYWRDGARLPRAEGRRAVKVYVAEMEARLRK